MHLVPAAIADSNQSWHIIYLLSIDVENLDWFPIDSAYVNVVEILAFLQIAKDERCDGVAFRILADHLLGVSDQLGVAPSLLPRPDLDPPREGGWFPVCLRVMGAIAQIIERQGHVVSLGRIG
jgi:hypothetical protein